MARGGARGRSGPAPDPTALVREKAYDQGEWLDLPQAGRQGGTPDWPLSEPGEWELRFWEREWKRPQAVMWERNSQFEEVALYCRALADAQSLDAKTPSRTLVKQMMENLGISIPGLMRNRWRIIGGDIAEAAVSDAKPARAGMKVVAGGS